MSVKVSFISGFYNRSLVAKRTMDAMVNQTIDDYEVIVFDDCSSDDTFSVLDRYNKYAYVNAYRHEKNLGFTNGLIKALEIARGEYIAIQGSGDVSEKSRLEKQSIVLDREANVGVVGCFYDNIVEDMGLIRPRRPDIENITIENLVKGNVFSHGEVMFRRSFYDRVGGYRKEFKFCQDYDLWLRMVKVSAFSTIKEKLYNRYILFDGVSYDPKKFIFQSRYYLLCQRLALLPDREATVLIEKMGKDGPESIVRAEDSDMQKRILFACLRLLVWGNSKYAIELSAHIMNKPKKYFVKIIAWVFSRSISNLFKILLYKKLGIKKYGY